MKIKVVNQRLYLEPPETAEGTREYLKAEFSFSEEWDGAVKTAFFRGANGDTVPRLLEEDTCTVPAEVLAAPGRVGVSVSGTRGDTVITTDIKSFTVPATLSGGTPSDPEPTVWQQILDKVDETQQIAQSVRDLNASDKVQLALFRLNPTYIMNGTTYWLRDIVKQGNFSLISGYGNNGYDASTNSYSVRPVFAIG